MGCKRMGLEGITMNWREIIKNQITDSKQGVLTSDSPLPKKKNNRKECKKEISRWFKNSINIKDKYKINDSSDYGITIGRGIDLELWATLPESTACKILDWFKEELDNIPDKGGRTRSNSIDGFICLISAPAIYTHTINGKVNEYFKIRAEIKTELWTNVILIEINTDISTFHNYGQGDSFAEWGRNNLDFTK